MKTEFWRQSAAAIIATGLLAVAAVAQTGEATGEVKIEGDKPPAATSTASVKSPAKQAKPTITERDPFVNLVEVGAVSTGSALRPRSQTAGGASVRPAANPIVKAGAVAAAEPVEEVIVPAPEVTITGIVKFSGGHQAIVNSGTSSYIVKAGQKLGDYRVSSITDTAVTFTHTGKSFKIPIESDFGLKK